MNYSIIKYNDIVNGEGVRTSLFVSGCRNHCKGCFQPETWDFKYGKEFNESVELKIFNSMNKYVDGITILGGDPMEKENVIGLLNFIKKFKNKYPDKTIWVYTGYLFEDLKNEQLYYDFLQNIDVLVDGKFIEELKDISLKWKGSSNQRVIDVKKTLESKLIILYC